jgi:hypothetical protein
MIRNKIDEVMQFRYGNPDDEVWKEQALCKGKLHLFFPDNMILILAIRKKLRDSVLFAL